MTRKISTTAIPAVGTTGTLTRRVDECHIMTKIWGCPSPATLEEAFRDASTMLGDSGCWILDASAVLEIHPELRSALARLLANLRDHGSHRLIVVTEHPGLRMLLLATNTQLQVSLRITATLKEAETLTGAPAKA